MEDEALTVAVRDSSVTVLRRRPSGAAARVVFIYAPGAGSNLRDPFGVYLAPVLAEAGVETWRLEFPYMAAGKKRPDSPGLLVETWRAVLQKVVAETSRPVVIGGRSMGGRIASTVAADGAEVSGLVLFAYPLIPPGGQPHARTEHLAKIGVPTLFCSGSRDSFGTPEQLRDAAGLVPNAVLHILEGADHGFAVLKSSGRQREDVWHEASIVLLDFLSRIESSSG